MSPLTEHELRAALADVVGPDPAPLAAAAQASGRRHRLLTRVGAGASGLVVVAVAVALLPGFVSLGTPSATVSAVPSSPSVAAPAPTASDTPTASTTRDSSRPDRVPAVWGEAVDVTLPDWATPPSPESDYTFAPCVGSKPPSLGKVTGSRFVGSRLDGTPPQRQVGVLVFASDADAAAYIDAAAARVAGCATMEMREDDPSAPLTGVSFALIDPRPTPGVDRALRVGEWSWGTTAAGQRVDTPGAALYSYTRVGRALVVAADRHWLDSGSASGVPVGNPLQTGAFPDQAPLVASIAGQLCAYRVNGCLGPGVPVTPSPVWQADAAAWLAAPLASGSPVLQVRVGTAAEAACCIAAAGGRFAIGDADNGRVLLYLSAGASPIEVKVGLMLGLVLDADRLIVLVSEPRGTLGDSLYVRTFDAASGVAGPSRQISGVPQPSGVMAVDADGHVWVEGEGPFLEWVRADNNAERRTLRPLGDGTWLRTTPSEGSLALERYSASGVLLASWTITGSVALDAVQVVGGRLLAVIGQTGPTADFAHVVELGQGPPKRLLTVPDVQEPFVSTRGRYVIDGSTLYYTSPTRDALRVLSAALPPA